MRTGRTKRKLRSVLAWVLWVILAQVILINISASLYAYKITHLYTPDSTTGQDTPRNILAKTWRLFTGPKFYRQPLVQTPSFHYSTIALATSSGIPIEAWFSKADSNATGTVVLFHGLTSNKGQLLDEAMAFRGWGFNTMLVDMRSHGKSGGKTTTIGFNESEEVKLAYDYLRQQGENNIFLWGTSMGAVAIMKAVAEDQLSPSGIILEMPFLSLRSHLKGRAHAVGFPEEPFAFLTTLWIGLERGFNGFGFKTTRYARKINCPVLQQYGEKDEFVIRSETDSIYNAISSTRKKLVLYDNAIHESFLRKDPETWKREVSLFLKQYSPVTF